MSLITDEHIINKFREMVGKRYDRAQLKERFDIPDTITEEMVDEIKHFFLDSIYPEATKRKELEEAFAGLGSYVRSPRKIWGLLGNMTSAIFKFGRQFPTALRAGMTAMEAFVGAKNFEAEMVTYSHSLEYDLPISDEAFEKTMARLPKEDIENFIKDVKKLFGVMTNTKLLTKTMGILDNVAATMERKTNLYPQKEVDGIKLGRSIMQGGYDLFSKYDEDTKQLMVEVIYKNEIWNSDTVFKKWA